MRPLCPLLTLTLLVLLVAPVRAQPLQLEWEAPPGASPVEGFAPLKPAEFLMDADGDGVRDLAMFDTNRQPTRLVVRSGADRSMQWIYPLGFEIDGKGSDVRFYDVAGDGGLKEAVISQRRGTRLIGVLEGGKVNIEEGVVLFGQQYVLLGIDDYDDDGDIELYLGETEKRVVQLWGPGD